MARNFFSLAAPNPGNQQIDFSAPMNALEGLRQQNNLQGQIRRQQEEQTYQRGRESKQDARQETFDNMRIAEALAKRADGISRLPPEQIGPAWKRHLAEHERYFPGNQLDPEDLDPMTGPQRYAAAFGGIARDPMDEKMKQAELAYKQAATDQLRQKAEPNPILEMLKSRARPTGGAAPAGGQAPMVQPQSNTAQPGMPGVILANEADPQAAPIAQPTEPMVSTPFGEFTRQDAEALAYGLMADPKTAQVGRALFDQVAKSNPAGLEKPAINAIEERTISAASTLGRLQEIRRQNKPKFQQIPNKLKMTGLSWGAAMGAPLSPEMQKDLSDFAKYKLTAYDNFNQLLKELSGTAVSAQELARQKIVQPNPGEGIFDGDDPVTFEAKIDQGERVSRMAIARMNFMRNRGLNFNKETAEQFLRLEDVPAAMDRRGAEIEQELKRANPNADPTSIEREALNRVRKEFGI